MPNPPVPAKDTSLRLTRRTLFSGSASLAATTLMPATPRAADSSRARAYGPWVKFEQALAAHEAAQTPFQRLRNALPRRMSRPARGADRGGAARAMARIPKGRTGARPAARLPARCDREAELAGGTSRVAHRARLRGARAALRAAHRIARGGARLSRRDRRDRVNLSRTSPRGRALLCRTRRAGARREGVGQTRWWSEEATTPTLANGSRRASSIA